MQIYRKLRTKLEELGYKVLTSRDSDIDVDFITERSRMVNKTNSDIFYQYPLQCNWKRIFKSERYSNLLL